MAVLTSQRPPVEPARKEAWGEGVVYAPAPSPTATVRASCTSYYAFPVLP